MKVKIKEVIIQAFNINFRIIVAVLKIEFLGCTEDAGIESSGRRQEIEEFDFDFEPGQDWLIAQSPYDVHRIGN